MRGRGRVVNGFVTVKARLSLVLLGEGKARDGNVTVMHRMDGMCSGRVRRGVATAWLRSAET